MLEKIKSLRENRGFRKYFFNTSWMFTEQLLRMVAGLLVGIWVARYLGPQQFGVFSYVLAFVAIFGVLAKLGLDSIVVRDLVTEPDKRDVYLGTAFWLKLAGAFITLGVIAFVTQFSSNDHTTNLYIFIVAAGLVFQSFEVIDFHFQSVVLSKFVSICKLAQLVLSSILKLYFVLTGADLFWFVLVSLIDQVSLAVTLVLAYRYQKIGSFYRRFDLILAKKMLMNSWPLIFSGLVIMVYMRIDQIMIKEMLGEREVGLYSAAVRLSEVWYFIPMIITSSLLPAIVGAKKVSEALYYARLQSLFTLMVWSAIAIAVPVTVFSDQLVTQLYGDEYSPAGQVLLIHVWAGVFVFLGVASSSWLTSENLQRVALHRTVLGVVVNVALNFVLIPLYGLNGAAIATVTAQLMATFVFDVFFRNTRKVFFMKLNAFNIARVFRRN